MMAWRQSALRRPSNAGLSREPQATAASGEPRASAPSCEPQATAPSREPRAGAVRRHGAAPLTRAALGVSLSVVVAAVLVVAGPSAPRASAAVCLALTCPPQVVATVPVGYYPQAVGVNPLSGRVYVSNYRGGSVSVIDPLSNTTVATIPLAGQATGIAINPLDGRLYVGTYGSEGGYYVSVIDPISNTVGATIPVGNSPYGVAINPARGRVYVTNRDGASVSVIDTGSNAVAATIPIPGGRPSGVDVNTISGKIYVTDTNANAVHVINPDTNTVTTTIPVGEGPLGVKVNPLTGRVYVAGDPISVIDGNTDTLSARIDNEVAWKVALNPLNGRLWFTNRIGHVAAEIDTITNKRVSIVDLGDEVEGIDLNPVTGRVYVAHIGPLTEGSSTVSVIDRPLLATSP